VQFQTVVSLIIIVISRHVLPIEHADTISVPFLGVLAALGIVNQPVGPIVHRKTLVRIASSIGMKRSDRKLEQLAD
jgi:hypothetical protein